MSLAAPYASLAKAQVSLASVTAALNNLMDKIEKAESDKEILKLIKDCCSNELFATTPILREILVKIIHPELFQPIKNRRDGE